MGTLLRMAYFAIGVNERNSKVGFEASEQCWGSDSLRGVKERNSKIGFETLATHLQSARIMKQGLLNECKPCFIFVAILQWASEDNMSGSPQNFCITALQRRVTELQSQHHCIANTISLQCKVTSYKVTESELPTLQFSAPGGARTPNTQFRRLMLYPIELQAQVEG
jgi:hypothetical protein